MKLYSKLGSIPKPETDGTDGWVEVPVAPTPGPGEELVWWCPPGWVVRPVMPDPVDGHCWSWSQSQTKWVLCVDHTHGEVLPTIEVEIPDAGSAIEIITGVSSGPTIV